MLPLLTTTRAPAAQYALDKITPTTQELSLGHNSLRSEGVVHLFQELRALRDHAGCAVEKMTLSANALGNDALREMAVFLDGDWTLRELYLPHNAIDVSAGGPSAGAGGADGAMADRRAANTCKRLQRRSATRRCRSSA